MWPRPAVLDWLVALTGVALTEWVVWTGTLGTHVAGPRWFGGAWPLLLDVPLAWRRAVPLMAWLVVLAGFVLHPLVTHHSAEGLELLFPIAVGAYAVAAYTGRRTAVAGLAAFLVAYPVYAVADPGVRGNVGGGLWAAAFFGAATIALWLAGVWMHSRRETAALALRAAEAEREAAAAVVDERARLARELHDIVSHNLSVVVLQAAGARAAGAGERTLEKIERSGREALVEMRRLLGVLRDDDTDRELAPQPGLAQLEQLAADVRAAGVPVDLHIEGDCDGLSAGVQLNVYRIVQEALTNVLKHAGPAHARVGIARSDGRLDVVVTDDGVGSRPEPGVRAGGHGLLGIRERVALLDGDLRAGPLPGGGFAVEATLPLET